MTTINGEATPVDDDALLREAAELRGAAGIGPQPGEPAAPAGPTDWKAEADELVEWSYAMFAPLFPRIEPIYTPEKRRAIAAPLAAVCEKYGFTLAEFFRRWGPEFMLAAAVAPVIVPTVRAVRDDLADLKAAHGEADTTAGDGKPAGPDPANVPNPRAAAPMPAANFGQ